MFGPEDASGQFRIEQKVTVRSERYRDIVGGQCGAPGGEGPIINVVQGQRCLVQHLCELKCDVTKKGPVVVGI